MSLLQVPHAGKRWMVGFRRQAAAELTSLGGQNDVIAWMLAAAAGREKIVFRKQVAA
jgi:hypothetical protein